MSKASTSFLGALNSTKSISSSEASFFSFTSWLFGTFLSPILPSDDEIIVLDNNKIVATIFKMVRKELLLIFSRDSFYIFLFFVLPLPSRRSFHKFLML